MMMSVILILNVTDIVPQYERHGLYLAQLSTSFKIISNSNVIGKKCSEFILIGILHEKFALVIKIISLINLYIYFL